MPTVHLDIAGLYFGIAVTVAEDANVKDVLDAAQAATANGAADNKWTFTYQSEDYLTQPPGRTVNTLTVVHRNNSAKSRQNGGGTGRVYPDGIYSFTDDAISDPVPGAPPGPLQPKDANQNNVRSWQYYIYDENGVEQARRKGAPGRTINPFDRTAGAAGYKLTDHSTVVWRLVTIFVRPTHANASEVPTRTVNTALQAY